MAVKTTLDVASNLSDNETEKALRKLKFFNLDLHISVIADLKNIFERQGHTVVDWSISGHTWVFGRKRDEVKIINQDTWQGLNQEMCDDFYDYYKDFFETFDAFIVTFNSSFALLYERTCKPIIVVNPTRYENPFTEYPEKWQWLNEYLQKGVADGRIVIVSNNRGDENYLRYYTGINSQVIPSLCLYTNSFYSGRRQRFILVSRIKDMLLPKSMNKFVEAVGSFSPALSDKLLGFFKEKKGTQILSRKLHKVMANKDDELKDGYTWQSLYDFKGIVHIPYQVSTMSIFEQYSANVPLFFPTKRFLFELHKKYPDRVLCELSFYQVKKLDYSGLADDNPNNIHNDDVVKKWIDLADYYDKENMPFIQYFDSFEHLGFLLSSVDCAEVSNHMREFNKSRRESVFHKWENILEQIFCYAGERRWQP